MNKGHEEIIEKEQVVVYTDGACSININNNEDIGGWAYLIMHDNGIIKGCGGYKGRRLTCNLMELKSIKEAMDSCFNLGINNIKIYSDSAYVINIVNNDKLDLWFKSGWKRKDGRWIKNRKYWKEIYGMMKEGMKVEFEKVKAHSGDRYNETVDALAKGAIKDVRTRENCQ